MKVLITGASGFIGRHLVSALRQADCEVTSLERSDRKPMVAGMEIVCWAEGDALPAQLLDRRFDVLYHLAWDTSQRGCWSTQLQQLERLLELCNLLPNVGKVVSLGSSDEYGPQEGILKESHPPRLPLNPYGWGKISAYNMLSSKAQLLGIPVAWLRAFTVYGEGQSGDMLIPYAIRMAKTHQPAKFTDGLQERDFIYVGDVVRALVLAGEREISGSPIINVGTGVGTRVCDVIGKIGAHYGAQDLFQLGAIDRRADLPMSQVAETSIARDLLGASTYTDVWAGLEGILE